MFTAQQARKKVELFNEQESLTWYAKIVLKRIEELAREGESCLIIGLERDGKSVVETIVETGNQLTLLGYEIDYTIRYDSLLLIITW